jgi:hypothetical protein
MLSGSLWVDPRPEGSSAPLLPPPPSPSLPLAAALSEGLASSGLGAASGGALFNPGRNSTWNPALGRDKEELTRLAAQARSCLQHGGPARSPFGGEGAAPAAPPAGGGSGGSTAAAAAKVEAPGAGAPAAGQPARAWSEVDLTLTGDPSAAEGAGEEDEDEGEDEGEAAAGGAAQVRLCAGALALELPRAGGGRLPRADLAAWGEANGMSSDLIT